jgi:hypothetical protein
LDASSITTGTLDASKVTVTNLNASNITAGILKSKDYVYDGTKSPYSNSGMGIDLDNKCLRSTNFAIQDNGTIVAQNVDIKGVVGLESGSLGGWSVETKDFNSVVTLSGEREYGVSALSAGEFTDANGYKYQAFLTPKNLWMYTEEYSVNTSGNKVVNIIYPKSWREISMTPEITVHNIKGGRRLLLRNPQDKALGWQKYFDFMDKDIDLNTTLESPVILFKDLYDGALSGNEIAHIPDYELRIPNKIVVYATSNLGKPYEDPLKIMGQLRDLHTFPADGITEWHTNRYRVDKPEEDMTENEKRHKDRYFSYSLDCGITWSEPIEIGTGRDTLMENLTTSYDIYSNGVFITNVSCQNNQWFHYLFGFPTSIVRYTGTSINLNDIILNNVNYFAQPGTYNITVRARRDGYNESADSNTKVYIVSKSATTSVSEE